MKTIAPAIEPHVERQDGSMMSQPIRVLHFADVHIGMENYGTTDPETGVSSRVFDFLARMDEMIEYAREGDVDLVIFAGDAFRSRSPNPTYQREFAARIRRLSQLAPTVLLAGNHDIPMNAAKASTVEIYRTLDVPGVWAAQDYDARRLETKRGPVVIGAAPYPIRARLLEAGSTVGTASIDGRTALMFAASNGNAQSVQALLEHGSPIDAVDNLNESALVHAALMGRIEVVEVLKDRGAASTPSEDLLFAARVGRTAEAETAFGPESAVAVAGACAGGDPRRDDEGMDALEGPGDHGRTRARERGCRCPRRRSPARR